MELEDRIERYVTGDMDATEKASFEHEMSLDKKLEEEVQQMRLLRIEIIGQKMVSNAEEAFAVDRDDAVDRYLLNEMSWQEKIEFEDSLKWDEGLKVELENRRLLMTGIRLEKIDEQLKASAATAAATEPASRRIVKIAATIAVIIGIGGTGLNIYNMELAKSVGNAEWTEMRSARSTTPEYLESVDRGDFKEAVSIIDSKPSLSNDEKYDKAVILLKQGRKRQAKKLLREIGDERSQILLEKLSIWGKHS